MIMMATVTITVNSNNKLIILLRRCIWWSSLLSYCDSLPNSQYQAAAFPFRPGQLTNLGLESAFRLLLSASTIAV